jgi:hypothetical protein
MQQEIRYTLLFSKSWFVFQLGFGVRSCFQRGGGEDYYSEQQEEQPHLKLLRFAIRHSSVLSQVVS